MAFYVTLVVLIAVVFGLKFWTVNEYALTPGDATPVAPLVSIHGLSVDTHHDKIMLTDVYLQTLNRWQWIVLHFRSHVEFVPANELVDPGVPTDELSAQGFLEMYGSKQDAEVAAFRSLGWKVPSTQTGAIVNAVVAPSPARRAHLHVADEIVSVDAKVVGNSCDLIGDVRSLAPGTLVHLGVKRANISAKGVITWRAPTTINVTTAAIPKSASAAIVGCPGVTGSARSWLGLIPQDGFDYRLPAKVNIDTSNIGGPSAGLAMTLTLIDQLTKGSLTGHHVVAATGTIDVYGDVGDVGGVAEKTAAAQSAGAQYFIVPQVEVATAQANASPGLRIIGVTTLAQALNDLRAIGGAPPVPLTAPH